MPLTQEDQSIIVLIGIIELNLQREIGWLLHKEAREDYEATDWKSGDSLHTSW